MTTRIGLAVSADAVRAVAVRGKRVVWASEAPGGDIDALLAAAPVARWLRPVLAAAVGPHGAQVKLVTGLPEIDDAATLAAVIREGAGSYFLKNGAPVITSGVRVAGVGAAFAAAFDRPCIDAIEAACRARRWRMGLITPTAVALPLASQDQTFTWREGKVVLEITAVDRVLTSVRTRAADPADAPVPSFKPVPALAGLGAAAAQYAAAYGAALVPITEPLAFDPLAGGVWGGRRLRQRLAVPGLATLIALVALLLSPLEAFRAAGRARGAIEGVRSGQWQVVATTLQELERVTAILDDEREFKQSRTSATAVLAGLARALPDSSVLVGFEMNEDRVQIHVLTAKPAAVLAAIDAWPAAVGAEMVGAVRREAAAGRTLQRVGIQFGNAR